MAVGKFYDDIDVILKSMAEYLGIDEEEDSFDDLFGEDDDDDDDDLLDDVCCTMADVDKCGTILERYIDELVTIAKKPSDDAIMNSVERTVKKLNKLNEACECELIESTISDPERRD